MTEPPGISAGPVSVIPLFACHYPLDRCLQRVLLCQAWVLILKCCLWLSIDPMTSSWERSTLSHSVRISDSQMTHKWHELAGLCWRLLGSGRVLPAPAQPTPMPSYMGCAGQELKTLLSSAGQPAAPRQPSGVLGESWMWVLPDRNSSDDELLALFDWKWSLLSGRGLYWFFKIHRII